MPSDQAIKLWDDSINKRIFELIHATSVTDKLGGLDIVRAGLYLQMLSAELLFATVNC